MPSAKRFLFPSQPAIIRQPTGRLGALSAVNSHRRMADVDRSGSDKKRPARLGAGPVTVFKSVKRCLEDVAAQERFILEQASGDRNPSMRSSSSAGRSSTARPYRSSRRETRKSDTLARPSPLAAPAWVSPAVCSQHSLFLSYQAACSTRRTTAASRADLHRGHT